MWAGVWFPILGASSSDKLWREKMDGGGETGWTWIWIWSTYANTYTMAVVVIILTCHLVKLCFAFSSFFAFFDRSGNDIAAHLKPYSDDPVAFSSAFPQPKISTIIPDFHLQKLMDELDENLHENEKWQHVIDRRNHLVSYSAKCYKSKDGPLKYFSVTVFENCSAKLLKDFYMDNDFRKTWDKTFIEHKQLQVDERTGTEIGCITKRFSLLTPREYVLAWRLWQSEDASFYCLSKDCEHPLAPRQKKYVRVRFFRSGWRISKVFGRDACEIKMVHQEDAGLNEEMTKLAFTKGIWSYMCRMDNALRKYSASTHPGLSLATSAVTLIQKVPQRLDDINMSSPDHVETSAAGSCCFLLPKECSSIKHPKRPLNKLLADGLILLGGAVCLSRCHSNLGTKVAVAYILSKLTKRKIHQAKQGNSA